VSTKDDYLAWDVPLEVYLRITRLWIHLLVGVALGLCASGVGALPLGVRVLDTEQVLRDRTQTSPDGSLYLQDQQGTLRRFVTSIDDPIIVNQGDGEFHPASYPAVRAAIEAADARFLDRIQFDVYILPFPVVDPLGSWADGEAIYLSPGVRELAAGQVEYLIGHEAGHLVHRAFLPDSDREGWARYRNLRGIADTTRFNAEAVHRDRPHEIFAEDFRFLFGGHQQSDAEAIENPNIASPDQVQGLREFFLSLVGEQEAAPILSARIYPNPISAGSVLILALPAGTSPRMTAYDVQGRVVRSFENLAPMGDGTFLIPWDGKDDAGRQIPRGSYFCLVKDGGVTARVAIRVGR
jgi:hypothetical protein